MSNGIRVLSTDGGDVVIGKGNFPGTPLLTIKNDGTILNSAGQSIGGGGGGGVTALNTKTGSITLVAGTNVTITPGTGNSTIAAAGGGGGVANPLTADLDGGGFRFKNALSHDGGSFRDVEAAAGARSGNGLLVGDHGQVKDDADGNGIQIINATDGVRINAGSSVIKFASDAVPSAAGGHNLGSGNNGFGKLVLTEPGGAGDAQLRSVSTDPVDTGEGFGSVALDSRSGRPGQTLWLFGPGAVYRPFLEIIYVTGAPTVAAGDGCLAVRSDGTIGSNLYARVSGAWVAIA